MRKTLFALLGLVAIGMWALPAAAMPTTGGVVMDGPKVHPDPVPLENRAGKIGDLARGSSGGATLSGTLIKQTAVTSQWFLYPGACVQRALGTWSPKSTPVADSLQPTAGFPNSSGYTDNQPDIAGGNNTIAYTRSDQSLAEKLWNSVPSSVPAGERPAIINGTRSIWCGKFDNNYVVKVGYPNVTFQILYIDTGTHAGAYNFTFDGSLSAELNYDYVRFLGGGSLGQADHVDPLQNRRDLIDEIIANGIGGPHGDSPLLITFTGSIQASQTVTATGQLVEGAGAGDPLTVSYSINIPAEHRALYIVFTSDCLFSHEDGLWPDGNGQVLDDIAVSDNGAIYSDQVPPGGLDPFSGTILRGPYGSFGCVSSRVAAGIGELWQLAPGTENSTADICSPQKAFSTDLFFEGGDPVTNLAINKQFNSVVSCVFPVPVGTASLFATWGEYLDLPRFAGYVQQAEYRFHKGGGWTLYQPSAAGGGVVGGALQAWTTDGDELAAAVQADSVQIRYNIICIPPFAADQANCSNSASNALLYDDLSLRVVSGVPEPLFGIFPGSIAASMFVDGTILGTNCATAPCWPGNRGSDLGTPASHNIAVHDNWNSPLGDTVTIAIVTGLRKNGMGVNWKRGFDKSIGAGEVIAHSNGAFVPAFDTPRMIFRLFDPATKTWSPFDSTELIANAVTLSGVDTILVDSEYNMNWPPYDKVETSALLPGGFTINGINSYAALDFLPRGTRMQYYFKGTDINGGRSYTFSTDNLAREVEDLPTLPGSSLKAPDIIEFRVFPSAYAGGPAGSLLANRTNTPILNLDGVYTTWSFGYDPMTQALRALGVRADRWRHLGSATSRQGIGGHELPGRRPDRQSNFFPNYLEYTILDSLRSWYRIMIQSGHTRTSTVLQEEDAVLVEQWWRSPNESPSNQGDRCLFISGDDVFNTMLNTTGVDISFQISLAQNTFGVSSATNAWSGTNTTPFPTIDDRFAAASAGPGLAPANTYTYPMDGGCPGPNRFDALVKVASADAQNAVFYPNAQVAGVARMTEAEDTGDNDRSKALAYAYSIQFIRDPAYGPTNANYNRSGVENRMRVMYKFLTSCRGNRTSGQTSQCWPCPSPGSTIALMQADWNGQSSGFQTSTYGPLLPIQAGALATAVEVEDAGAAPRINKIEGNFPNPFNPQTAIKFSSAHAGKAQIRIFSVGGQLVRTLHANVNVGANEVRWNGRKDDGTSLASGVYFYKIAFPNGESFRAANSLVLVK